MQRYSGFYRDSLGRPVSGGLITVYVAGTATLATLYQAAGSITTPLGQANPITTDPNGFFSFAAPFGTYDIQMSGANAPTYIINNEQLAIVNVAGLPVLTAADVSFTQAGAGSVASNLQNKGEQIVFAEDKGVATTVVDNTAFLQAAIDDVSAAGGGTIYIGPGTFTFASTLLMRDSVIIKGNGKGSTFLSYTGAGTAISQITPGVRIFNIGLMDLKLTTSTGTIGLDLDATSTSTFERLVVNGFSSKGIYIHSATTGWCVYNNFLDVNAQNCPTGWAIYGLGSNSNRFIACRANVCSAVGFDIIDSNQNVMFDCQMENCGVGWQVEATVAGRSDNNEVCFSRFESNTTNWIVVSSNVRFARVLHNAFVTNATVFTDSGDRTQIFGHSNVASVLQSSTAASANGIWRFVNDQQSAGLPMMVFRNSNSAGGTPVTVQIETERASSTFIQGVRGGATKFSIDTSGNSVFIGTCSYASYTVSGTAGAGFYELLTQSSGPSAPAANGLRIYSDASGRMAWRNSSGFNATFDQSGLSATRIFTFPNVAGTFALSNAANTWTGAQDFTGATITVPTQTAADNTTKAASTAYVDRTPGSATVTSAAPTGTASATAVMMGLSSGTTVVTPVKTGRLMIVASGQFTNGTVNDGATVDLRTGTGNGPANGAAVTGTLRGIAQTMTAKTAAQGVGFCLNATITGLTLNTALWIDLSLLAVTGGTASITGASISVIEY